VGYRHNFGRIGSHNRSLVFIQRTCSLVRERELPVLFYSALLNQPMLIREHIFNPADFAYNLRKIQDTFRRAGFPLLDYAAMRAPSEEFFHDGSHLRDVGARWQAARLWDDSRDWLERTVGQPGGGKAAVTKPAGSGGR
jgi:hypothetical protein